MSEEEWSLTVLIMSGHLRVETVLRSFMNTGLAWIGQGHRGSVREGDGVGGGVLKWSENNDL